jgi:hypothetical protein
MAESSYAELELGLHQWNSESYTAELRFSDPSSEDDVLHVDTFRGIRFDIDALRLVAHDPAAYGRQLSEALFDQPGLRASFIQGCTRAEERDLNLRLRFVVGPSAPQLHTLRWETLQDPRPDDSRRLATNERILFSRYLSSAGYTSAYRWERVRKRRHAELSALVMIAAPAGLGGDEPGGWNLAPIDVGVERARAELGLDGIPVTVLAGPRRATLANLIEQLRNGADILYLVSHGAFIGDEAHLYLEDDAGNVAVTGGTELVNVIQDLSRLPRLVVLASCQSAGTGAPSDGDDGGAYLRALGPRLAEIGIPAVLAMQGDFSMESAATFLPAFYRELRKHGQIDRAMTVARGAIRDRHDYWMPVLFMRLRSGKLWYVPRFESQSGSYEGMPGLVGLIEKARATPILGPGMTDALLGSWRDIAEGLAERWGYPLAPHDRSDLPQVAQFLSVSQNRTLLGIEIEKHLKEAIIDRHGGKLDPGGDDTHRALRNMTLTELSSAVFRRQREIDDAEPHKVLAALPFPLYVTTSLTNPLFDALEDVGRRPERVICRWNEGAPPLPSVYDLEPDYRPSVDRPMIFHLFGHLDVPETVVLTEDDYFDYLIGVTKPQESNPIPFVVRSALTNSGLLFLGFHPDDWAFRVLFRFILGQDGSAGLTSKFFSHVAVQVEPDEDDVVSPSRAMSYLTKYFSSDVNINVFWGSVEDFASDLASYKAEPQS